MDTVDPHKWFYMPTEAGLVLIKNKEKLFDTFYPGCPIFLDMGQYAVAEMRGVTYGENGYGIPVFTYEEVAGLLFGYSSWDLGLQVHQVSVEPLPDKMGIPYDRDKKYFLFSGKNIEPFKPELLKV